MTSSTKEPGSRCEPCEGGVAPVGDEEARRLLSDLPGWEMREGAVEKQFAFANFHETMSFVNAVAWVANRQNHHPDLEVSYRRCRVRYSTHAIGGLSRNDFVCAFRIEQLLT